MAKRIVYTRDDGGVSICCPTDEIICWMSCGGLWNDRPRGFLETQIERQIARGIRPDVARRYVRAVQFGGCTTAEALEIIRDRDCRDGYAAELWNAADLPDRWFRDAWHRSANGGPISIDLKLARPIQWKRARAAVDNENKRRADDFDACLKSLIDLDWRKFRERIVRAGDADELRLIWPQTTD